MAKKPKGLAILIAGKPADEEEAPEEETPETYEYPEFTIPEGLDLSDLEAGDEKEVLSVVRKMSEDTACIVSVEGVDLTGEAAAPPPEETLPPPPPPAGGLAAGAGAVRNRAAAAGLL